MDEKHENDQLQTITKLILEAKRQAEKTTAHEPEPGLVGSVEWPIECVVGPGLEGAVACESKVGYVNGTKGWLIYRGYDIFDLCAHSSFEEVSYLLLHGHLPTREEYRAYQGQLRQYWHLPKTIRQLAGFPVEEMNPMAALRLGTNLMRQQQTFRDHKDTPSSTASLGTDDDSVTTESGGQGNESAVFEFSRGPQLNPPEAPSDRNSSQELASCYHLIAGIPTLLSAIHRFRIGHMPIGPKANLSHAANFLYMLTGEVPDPVSERIMDICLILHADHGMNASTFASMVVASTLSDIYFSVGAGIGALNGPLHGGANRDVITMLRSIGGPENVKMWFDKALNEKQKIPGFGHRVYKTHDPRALVLAPLAQMLAQGDPESTRLFETATALDALVSESLGKEKNIFPNVDFYSGLVYSMLGIPDDLFTPVFAVSRMAGWTARIMEYLEKNRIFRPRAIYTGQLGRTWMPLDQRHH